MGSKMGEFLTPGRREMLTKSMEGAVREPIKGAVKEAMEEAEAERSSNAGRRRVPRTLVLVGLGAAIGYVLRGRGMGFLGPFGSTAGREESPPATVTTRPEPTKPAEESDTAADAGRGIVSKLLMVGAIVALGYLLRTRTDSIDQLTTSVKQKTGMMADETAEYTEDVAEETEAMTEEVADRVAAGGETVAERIERGSEEMASEIEASGEGAAEQLEETGEQAEEMGTEAEESAGEMHESSGDDEENEEE